MILVLADLNLHATRSTFTAALQLGGDVHVLAVGSKEFAAQLAAVAGVSKVLHVEDNTYPLAENIAPLIAALAKNYSHVLAAATTTGKDILPRAAALLDVSQISDVVQVISPDTFLRPFYAGNALQTVQTMDAIKLLTIRQTAFAPAANGGNATIENIMPGAASPLSEFVSADETKSERPELTAARVVVSGGRGMGSAEDFKQLEPLADLLGGAIGASRAAVDSGFISNDHQVGQTGKVVAPDLYIAVGISGAIQHLAGMKDSKIIVAINKDENAAIFDVADYGLVMTWQEALPQLLELLGK
ncbi:MAG: electron transfer flavoprotein subunit alpha/FixB family protein [Alphaproteobacteria bacterium]|nr:electron transfer flavoprotein subunit alpha/FixB family protein [Alphaproteobacteria bacterium]